MACGLVLELLQRRKVALSEVHNVDVVAHARAVGGVVVAAKDGQRLPPPDRDLRHVRHQIVRRAAGVLADAAGGVRADGVEVAEGDDAPLLPGGRLPVRAARGFIRWRAWGGESAGGFVGAIWSVKAER